MEQKLIISNLKDELKYAADSILKLNRLIAEFGNIAESKDISAALIKANEKWSSGASLPTRALNINPQMLLKLPASIFAS